MVFALIRNAASSRVTVYAKLVSIIRSNGINLRKRFSVLVLALVLVLGVRWPYNEHANTGNIAESTHLTTSGASPTHGLCLHLDCRVVERCNAADY